MKILNIYGKNYSGSYSHIRVACRGIIKENDKILLCYESKDDQWMIPGGGLEGNESYEDCCIRELAEETGYKVKPTDHFLILNEYYGDWLYVSHYFICEPIGKTERKLTEFEQNVGLEPKWLDVEKAIREFSKYESYVSQNSMKSGMYQREYIALSSVFKA